MKWIKMVNLDRKVGWGVPFRVLRLYFWMGCLVSTCFATSFVEQPFPLTIQDAPIIVRGKIGKTAPDWGLGADGSKRIYTFSDLEVSEVFKGHLTENSIVIRELGGEKDGVGMQVSGSSSYQKGEDVVVLLSERNSEGTYSVRGLMMGKYNLQKNQAGEEVLIGPGISSVHAIEKRSQPGAVKEWTLEALRQEIRAQQTAPGQLKPSPSPLGTPVQASALQPVLSQEPKVVKIPAGDAPDGFLSRFILVWIALGVLVAWVIFRRRR